MTTTSRSSRADLRLLLSAGLPRSREPGPHSWMRRPRLAFYSTPFPILQTMERSEGLVAVGGWLSPRLYWAEPPVDRPLHRRDG
jgi:hypothetical protein